MDRRIPNNLDAIVEQLCRLEASGSSDEAISEAPATVSELKAELDTLISCLREPARPDAFAEELELQRALERVLAIGMAPEGKANARPHFEPLELKRIGPYELLEKLGEGGMGVVYKALHLSLDKIVAIKILPPDRLNPTAVLRFRREMKAVGRLDHPHIVRATDAGEVDGCSFLVMEFVDGVNLSELCRRVETLTVADACELVRQAAIGLQHAHQRGIVHRDIKPGNLMLDWSDELVPSLKILDLGLALLSEPRPAAQRDFTMPGSVMGTLEYIAPEQFLDTHQVDIRADIYSLGATLYRLLCGQPPFSRERFNTPGKLLVAMATETPPSLGEFRGDLPSGLIEIVIRMLARQPADRPPTPAEVAQLLTPFAIGADLVRLAHRARQLRTSAGMAEVQMTVSAEALNVFPETTTNHEREAPKTKLHKLEAAAKKLVDSPSPTSQEASGKLKRRFESRNLNWLAAVVLCALVCGGLLFAAPIIRIVTNQGTIVIETDGSGVEVLIKDQQGKILIDGETKREITLKAGDYNIEVTVRDSGGEQRFVTDHFTLTRNGREIVDARWEVGNERTAVALPETNSSITDPDRRAAEYVLSIGGQISFNGIDQWIGVVGDLPKGPFELTRVTLDPNPQMVSDTGLANFADCRNLTFLYLRDAPISDVGLAYFKDCKNLISLSLSGKDVSDLGLVHFADCRNLTSLDLGGRYLTDAGMAHFKDCKQLTSLRLTWTNVSDRGLAHFKDCENLTSLLLFEMPVTDAGLAHFQNCQNLTSLSLFSRQLTDAGLVHFRNCKNLEQLQLAGMLAVSDEGLANFRNCRNLIFLDLQNSNVSDAGLAHFQDCTYLTSIAFNNTQISDAGLERLSNLAKLNHLYAVGSRVTAAGVKKLSAALPECRIEWETPPPE